MSVPPSEIRSRGPGGGPPDRIPAPRPRALVLYATRFGNTARIASALTRGLEMDGTMEAVCAGIDEWKHTPFSPFRLVAIGGPTEIFSASRSMKQFLAAHHGDDLRGTRFFAFDTRYPGRVTGSAARFIERELRALGAQEIRTPESAFVRSMSRQEGAEFADLATPEFARRLSQRKPQTAAPPAPDHLPDLLLPGMEAEFERIGRELAVAVTRPSVGLAPLPA